MACVQAASAYLFLAAAVLGVSAPLLSMKNPAMMETERALTSNDSALVTSGFARIVLDFQGTLLHAVVPLEDSMKNAVEYALDSHSAHFKNEDNKVIIGLSLLQGDFLKKLKNSDSIAANQHKRVDHWLEEGGIIWFRVALIEANSYPISS